MKPLHDYFYRFPREPLQIPGRCRVRIYKRKNGTHTVVLTELNSNAGESITSACARIATHLVVAKALNPKTTRWIQHDPTHEDMANGDGADVFEELHFTWGDHNTACDPEWQALDDAQVAALTGDSLTALSRVMGDQGPPVQDAHLAPNSHAPDSHAPDSHVEEGIEYESIEAKRTA